MAFSNMRLAVIEDGATRLDDGMHCIEWVSLKPISDGRQVVLKASAKDRDGRPLLLIGLSTMNIARLHAKQPMAFDAKEFGFDGRIVIMAGDTEEAIKNDLVAAGIQLPEPHETGK